MEGREEPGPRKTVCYEVKHDPTDGRLRRFGTLSQSGEEITLIQLMEVLARQDRYFAFQRSNDPLKYLPVELVWAVMNWLSMTDRLKCLRVCTHWNRYLKTEGRMWQTLNLPLTRHPLRIPSVDQLRKYLSWAGHGIKQALVAMEQLQGQGVPELLVQLCPRLDCLEICLPAQPDALAQVLKAGKNLQSLILSRRCFVNAMAFPNLTTLSGHLVRLEVHSITSFTLPSTAWLVEMPNLEVLYLGSYRQSHQRGPRGNWPGDLLPKAPHLRTLTVASWNLRRESMQALRNLTKLAELEVIGCALEIVPALPSSLRVLQLINCRALTSDENISMNFHRPKLFNLEILEITNASFFRPEMLLMFMASSRKRIRQLNIAHACRTCNFDEVIMEACKEGLFAECVDLDLTDVDITDAIMEHLSYGAPKLRRLNLWGTKVTGNGLKRLIVWSYPGEKVQWVCLERCMSVVLEDAVWLGRQGIEVIYTPPGLENVMLPGMMTEFFVPV